MGQLKFGTGGFRAVMGEQFNKINIQKICQAMSNLIDKKNLKREICIGYDNRFMSEVYAQWCAEVFAGNGIRVELFDRATSSPVAMYATKVKGNDYGVMITASHNPYEYNGIKIFITEGRDAGVAETEEIENEFKTISKIRLMRIEKALNKRVFKVNYLNEYVDNIINLLRVKDCCKGLKIVFDAMHGSTVEEIEMLAERMGIHDYKIINNNRDAHFGFKVPAPSLENIIELKQAVKEYGADIGFALDADGDRLAVVDANGNYIDNNYILAITYYFFVQYCSMKGDSVKNVATSNLLDMVSEKFGYKCHEVPVGFKYVSSALIKENAVVGGESSGGLAVHGHIWGKDSLLAIAICLKAMIVMNKSFAEVFEEVKDFVGGYEKIVYDKQYQYNPQQKKHIDKVLFEEAQTPKHRFDVEKIVFKDYIKVYYKNGNWSLVRFSGTEPILRIFVEAKDKEEAQIMVADWEELLKI